MNSYRVLSAYYDRFTQDVGYDAWADYFEEIFKRAELKPRVVLDLACGTGTMTALLARRGYDMIGVDASTEMLTQAQCNTETLLPRPLLVQQRMEHLELYGEIDACICCLDSVNYVVDPNALAIAFTRVEYYLQSGGIFIFDVNTPKKFHDIAGQSYVREDGDVYCVWQCAIEDTLCTYDFDIFENKGQNTWKRYRELHEERIYTADVLQEMLGKAGFCEICCYPELSFGAITGEEQRLFFTARKA